MVNYRGWRGSDFHITDDDLLAKDIELITIDARECAKQLTLKVETRVVNFRWVRFRLWLAVWVCKFATWLGGIGLEINQEIGVLLTEQEEEEEEDSLTI